ncbi:putative bifunctional inhibitor/plant lipid transfer protein/seed storage helical [Helianthus annuus]|uniref:Bifunctional inhibitor/plant lipid transfer protein/seed storage helical n=1 Tax=Helianthus annuus TaxID=4232 RepID=A0A251RS81_HELAN|nr:putative bifunctional inhibitor/plant lipid transfer protein/seed storage helical [Helianthus annuus]KAJ0429721.1 putative bifunctional inhibitor/plant lipid transfer protein/seed storage helical [Helianthus annuus]KAJ0448169.1 putative bifunctional inhibitor/plant lipid transfer protein/seed storage helical [Helianthus annuus]KAJ0633055.1 putative bifunctional inhibitor/plant lipid transfer protein/seed storage helical [Helianthus annuus]KAJ0808037.1 putative bifunctional inhibitor/plant li
MRSAAYAVALLMMILAGSTVTTTAVTCSVSELSPCLPSFTSAAKPSAQCCNKLKEQKPCLCGYIKNPSLKQYVSSPNAKKVASTCGVPIPNC